MKTISTHKKSTSVKEETEERQNISDNNLKQLQNIFRNAPAAIAVYNGINFKFSLANTAYEKTINRQEIDLLGKSFFEIFPELKNTDVYKLYKDVYENGISFNDTEYAALMDINNDGVLKQCYFNFSMEPLKNDEDEIYAIISMAYDVTQQVELRKKNEANEISFRNLVEQAPVAMCVFRGENYVIELANNKHLQLLGKTKEQVINIPAFTAIPEAIGQGYEAIFDGVYNTGIPFIANETPLEIIRNGKKETIYVNFVYEPLYDDDHVINGIFCVATDVTEQVLARNKFEESQTYYQTLTDNTPVMIWMTRPDGYCNYLNKQWYDYTAQTKKTGLGVGWLNAIHPDDSNFAQINFNNACQKQIPFTFDYRLKNKEGEYRWHKDSGCPQFDKQGNFEGLIGSVIDIHESVVNRKKIEESEHHIRQIKEQLELSIQAGNVGVWHWDVKKDILTWSKEQRLIYGIDDSEIISSATQFNNLIVSEDLLRIQNDQSTANKLEHEYDFRINRKNDGALRWIKSKARNTLDSQGALQSISGVNIDITEQVLARKKIEETEHKYHNIIYTSPYMIAIFKGKNLIIEIANDAILETWDKGKDVIGKSFYDVLPEAVEQGFDKLILNVFETGEPYHAYETPITLWRNEKWQLMHYNFIYQAQRNVQGDIEGVAILANEVTPHVLDKMRIIESEERFRLLADNLPVSIFIADATLEDNITYVNKYWLDFTKQTFDNATHNGWFSTLHPEDKHLVMSIYEPAFKNREPYIIPNFRLKRFDGEYRWFTFQATPRYLPNGEFEGYMGAGFDITEQKLFELELIEEKIKAENAVQTKQQFLSNMSHEIRTPMNAIVGFTNVILKTELNDSQKQYLDAIKVSGDALVILINDILDLAKVDAGKMTFDKIEFDLVECIHKIVVLFELKLIEKKLKFNLTLDDAIPNQIIGDPMRLRQIILNLLSNAIKFTDKGSISLDAKVLSHIKNKINIEFKITDTGIGIANEKLEAIFDNFEQAHSETSANYGGTGLGLAIVKKLVENQGGTIETNSEVGKGSTFAFNLQFETNISQHKVPKKTSENDMICQSDTQLKNIKILVAEDVALNQLLIKVVLGNFNFEVDIAENGKIAIEKIQTNTYNLVLMDLHMPEMNGFEATKYIREEMKSQIPIIALTADVTQADIDKCMAVGMNDYISKPIEETILYEKIIKVLNAFQK